MDEDAKMQHLRLEKYVWDKCAPDVPWQIS